MRKVLIVSPHFPPVNAPDMQRVRLALPYLRAQGWEPVVLAVHPDSVEGPVIEPLLEKTYPDDIRVIRVRGIPAKLTRKLGMGSLWWRCGRSLRMIGDALLGSERFDLVFFTTTQFDAFTLGPRWKKRFGVPFVLDYQDPWVNDYYRRTGTRPPGGPFKFWLSQFTARRREPRVLGDASGIITVSAAYASDLQARHPWLSAERICLLPFGTSAHDFEVARRHAPAFPLVPFGDGHVHHVYTGRCGHDMRIALTALFLAFKQFRHSHPNEAARHRFHFIGTDYAPAPLGKNWVKPLADEAGVGDAVSEHSGRVPYFDALYYMANADALMLVGSDDPTYNASKLAPCLLANRPLLAIAHSQSPMIARAADYSHTLACGFASDSETNAVAEKILHAWFVNQGYLRTPPETPLLPASQNAADMAVTLAKAFNAAVASALPPK